MSVLEDEQRQRLMKISIVQLRKRCKKSKLSSQGNKTDIVGRLIAKTLATTIINEEKKEESAEESQPTAYFPAYTGNYKHNDTALLQRYFEDDGLLDEYQPLFKIVEIGHNMYFGKTLKKLGKLEAFQPIIIKKSTNIFRSENTKKLLTELRVSRRLKTNENILKIHDIISPKHPLQFDTLTVIMQVHGVHLGKIINSKRYNLQIVAVQRILYQILLGVQHMHCFNIAHRNLNPFTIFVNRDCEVKIGGFDEAEVFDKNKHEILFSNANGRLALYYKPPELLLLEQKTSNLAKGDIWSIGAIFAELLGNDGPIFRTNQQYLYSFEQVRFILSVIGNPLSSEIKRISDKETQTYLKNLMGKKSKLNQMFPKTNTLQLSLLKEMLKFDVNSRITIKRALQHKCITSMRYNRDTTNTKIKSKKTVKKKTMKNNHRKIKKKFNILKRFESKNINEEKWRNLILWEILEYNKSEKMRFMNDGAMSIILHKTDIFLDGYIRKYIEPLFNDNVIIPLSIIAICCQYLKE